MEHVMGNEMRMNWLLQISRAFSTMRSRKAG